MTPSDRTQQARRESVLLPQRDTCPEFGKVWVRRVGEEIEVELTLLREPQGELAEGWRTAVALDASASMRDWYGRNLRGELPPELKGSARTSKHRVDGSSFRTYPREVIHEAVRRGYLRFTPNIVQPCARDFIAYLAEQLDVEDRALVLYWACGDGDKIEVLGEPDVEECRDLEISGPHSHRFGEHTLLMPAFRYLTERFREAKRAMLIFLTDGRLEDLDEVKAETTRLARAIADGSYPCRLKCILIGVGNRIDRQQMRELDDLETGTDSDLWDHKIAKELRVLSEIFAEVVQENRIVAPQARVLDASGRVVKSYTDGLTAQVRFSMSADSPWFELDIEGQRLRQEIPAPERESK